MLIEVIYNCSVGLITPAIIYATCWAGVTKFDCEFCVWS